MKIKLEINKCEDCPYMRNYCNQLSPFECKKLGVKVRATEIDSRCPFLLNEVGAQNKEGKSLQPTTGESKPCHEHIESMAAWNDKRKRCAVCGQIF